MLKMNSQRQLSPDKYNGIIPAAPALPITSPDRKKDKEPPALLYDYLKWEEDWEIK